jgi:hypothetical protein
MRVGQSVEWLRLGARLAEICPEKFDEILDALRETVGAHEILATSRWVLGIGPTVLAKG